MAVLPRHWSRWPHQPRAAEPAGGTQAGHGPSAAAGTGGYRRGLLWAGAAGVLWGSYFVPAQWAKVPTQAANFPLALGILAAGFALALPAAEPVRLSLKVTTVQLVAGVLFGIGNLTLLGLVSRVGTGVGFTIAQLSLLVNASVGIWVFKMPRPGSRAAKRRSCGHPGGRCRRWPHRGFQVAPGSWKASRRFSASGTADDEVRGSWRKG